MSNNYKIEFTKFAAKKYAKLCKKSKILEKQISKALESLSVDPFSPSFPQKLAHRLIRLSN
jgi:mRNA-degrading endonuclease RelE of RelBE toxin-antitoxin system